MEQRSSLKKLKRIFTRDKTICRAIAAWCSFAMLNLFGEGEYFKLAFAQQTSMAKMLLLTGIFFVLYSAVSYLVVGYETDSWFLLVAATVCSAKWLLAYEDSSKYIFVTIGIVAVYLLFLFYFIRVNNELIKRIEPNSKVTLVFAILCGVTMATVVSIITCLRYKTFSAPNFDFGLFCNMFYNMKETGLPMVTSERDRLLSHFAVHISPAFYILLPFYYIFPSPLTLQIGQAVVLASGVIPVWLLARHFKFSGKMTMAVSAMYAFFPALSGGCFYDIHENCFLAPLLLWTFYFFEREKYIPMYIFAVSVLLVKEDAAIYLLVFALFVLLARKKYLHGITLAVLSIFYFGVATYLLVAIGDGVLTNRFGNLIFDSKDGLFGAAKTALFNPGYLVTQLFTTSGGTGYEKIIYFLQIFLPVGFLPFCTKKTSKWILMAPILISMVTHYTYLYDINFQYQFGTTAFFIYATMLNITELKAPTRDTLVTVGVVACVALWITTVSPKLASYTKMWDEGKEKYEQMEQVLDTIPEDASVSASTCLVAHIADRKEIYEVAYHNNVADVDYVVLDTRYKGYQEAQSAYRSQGYTIERREAGIIILKKPT